jgi:hypothetical protein
MSIEKMLSKRLKSLWKTSFKNILNIYRTQTSFLNNPHKNSKIIVCRVEELGEAKITINLYTRRKKYIFLLKSQK